jgi:hypothetical protein
VNGPVPRRSMRVWPLPCRRVRVSEQSGDARPRSAGGRGNLYVSGRAAHHRLRTVNVLHGVCRASWRLETLSNAVQVSVSRDASPHLSARRRTGLDGVGQVALAGLEHVLRIEHRRLDLS